MTGRELLLGSSFQFGTGGEDGGPSWTAWGRVATSGFEGREDDLSLSGDVTTGFLGADMARERWLAGVAVGLSEGEGSFDDGAGGGAVESSLTSVFPYARLGVSDGVDLWGLVGFGNGDLTLTVGEEVTRTDLSMQMGALGLRGELLAAEEADDFGLAVKTDAMWVRTESDAARSSTGGNLEAASGDVSRLRVALEGSQSIAMGSEATFTPLARTSQTLERDCDCRWGFCVWFGDGRDCGRVAGSRRASAPALWRVDCLVLCLCCCWDGFG